jgi:hypothetical protein
MEHKDYLAEVKELHDSGDGVLRFISFDRIDKDNDVTLRGFVGRQEANLLPSHNWRSENPPLGRGQSFDDDKATYFEFKLNLDLPLAKAWYTHLKFDRSFGPERALQQVSYGFSPYTEGIAHGQKDGRNVRFLRPKADGSPGAKLHEVSFVLVGAGVDTAVVDVKEIRPPDLGPDPETEVVEVAAPVRKRLTLDGLLYECEHQIAHLTFVQETRFQKGKDKLLNQDTIDKIDQLSRKFDDLRKFVRLQDLDHPTWEMETAKKHQQLTAELADRQALVMAHDQAEVEELFRRHQARQEQLNHLLHQS